jgi:hypothetical protein
VRPWKFLYIAMVGAIAVVGSGRSGAADLALEVAGVFGQTTTLGETAFGVDTPFAFRALFDSAHELFHTPGAGIFAITEFTVTIAWHGTFAGVPNIDLNAVVVDPTYHIGDYAAGLVDHTASSFFLDKYSDVAPPLNPQDPTPTIFVGYLATVGEFPYVIPLAGGAGDLAINDFSGAAPTVSLVAVPEPSSLLLLLAGLCGLILFASPQLCGYRTAQAAWCRACPTGRRKMNTYRRFSGLHSRRDGPQNSGTHSAEKTNGQRGHR